MGGKRKSAATLASAEASPPKRLRTAATIVQRKIRGNFRDATPEETDLIENPEDGLTLRRRLMLDFEVAWSTRSSIVWGRLYYDGLRLMYIKGKDLHALLQCDETS